jgi:hypothetical protein
MATWKPLTPTHSSPDPKTTAEALKIAATAKY